MHSKDTVKEICIKYENIKGVDKVAQIQDNLSEVTTLSYLDPILRERWHSQDA